MHSLNDAANYLLFTNPVSKGIVSGLSATAKLPGLLTQTTPKATVVPQLSHPLWKLAGSNLMFVRLAGLYGASAVAISAYGTHRKYPTLDDDSKVDLKNVFETANRVHFFHTLALLTTPLMRRPIYTGLMLAIGTALFCFPCYYRAFTGDKKYSKFAPIGGGCLVIAWLSMIL